MSLHTHAAQDKPKKKKILVPKVVNGVEQMVEIEVDDVDGPQWGPRESLTLLNHHLRRVDGPEKVTGRARYTYDMRLPGMVYARLLLCPFPSAQVELDCSAALKLPGVAAARALRGKNSLETRWLGQPIAVVAAETPELAEDALRAIVAKYTRLPWAVTAEQALAPGAGQVTKNGNVGKESSRGEDSKFEAAWAACDVKVEAEYTLPVQHHVCLETHGVVVDYRGGDEATVYASTQGTFTIPGEAAEALGLSAGKVTAIVENMGGGFGSKFGLGLEGQTACELAKELKRPVHLMMTREGEFLAGGNRSGSIVKVRAGATKDGKLCALRSDVYRLGGIGGGSFAGLPYVYKVANADGVRSIVRALYMHTDSSRAMRAPGHPQASFAMESALDELAYKLGIDPLTMRKRNQEKKMVPQAIGGADTLVEVDADPVYARQLDRAAERIGWGAHPNKISPQAAASADGTKTGIGFAIATWGGGGGPECEVKVSIGRDGSLQAIVGTQDLGNGTRTYVAAIAAEEFGLPLAAATAVIGNSKYGKANASGGSTTAASLSPAVKDAAYNARIAFLKHLAETTKKRLEQLAFRGGSLIDVASGTALMTWNEACAQLGTNGLSAEGKWQSSLASSGVHGAQAAKVSVDLATGHVRVLQMVGVQDCGLPLNRTAVESQLNGGMIQALSYALLEERVMDPDLGLMLNSNLTDYKIAGCQEMPELIALIDDDDTRGVIGMAEPAIVPGHGAIANAIFNACGVRLRSMPFTPDKVLDGLAALAKNGALK